MDTLNKAQAILDEAIELTSLRGEGWRSRESNSAGDKLDHLLSEIGRAILPRNIIAEIGSNSCVITVNSGRIVKTDLGGGQIHQQDGRDVRLGRVSKLLSGFASQEGVLRVWAKPLSEAPNEEEIGLSHGELREYCQSAGLLGDASIDGGEQQDRFDSFEEALGEMSETTALISPGSGVAVISGNPADLCAEDELRSMAQKLSKLTPGHPLGEGAWIVGHSVDVSDQSVGVLVGGDTVTFHTTPSDVLPMLARRWAVDQAKQG